MCTIANPAGKVMATIPWSDGLYRLAVHESTKELDYANIATVKMSINEAHRKLGHIAHNAIKHAVASRMINSIELDLKSKVDFCEACAKSKAICHPYPKQSQT